MSFPTTNPRDALTAHQRGVIYACLPPLMIPNTAKIEHHQLYANKRNGIVNRNVHYRTCILAALSAGTYYAVAVCRASVGLSPAVADIHYTALTLCLNNLLGLFFFTFCFHSPGGCLIDLNFLNPHPVDVNRLRFRDYEQLRSFRATPVR